jgi:LEA14-like dessication related protein
MMMTVRGLLVCLILVMLPGCATTWHKPSVSLVDVRMVGGNLLEQKLEMQLRVNNPNSRDIGIDDLTFELVVDDSVFVRGQSSAPVMIPKQGEGVIEVRAKAQMLGLISRLPRLLGEDGLLHYRLRGGVMIRGYGHVPYDHAGVLDPGKLQGLGAGSGLHSSETAPR